MSDLLDIIALAIASAPEPEPSDTADLDQQAAAIRRELDEVGLPIDRASLNLYAALVMRLGYEEGHNPGQPNHESPMTAWLGNRMAAVYQVAREAGVVP